MYVLRKVMIVSRVNRKESSREASSSKILVGEKGGQGCGGNGGLRQAGMVGQTWGAGGKEQHESPCRDVK